MSEEAHPHPGGEPKEAAAEPATAEAAAEHPKAAPHPKHGEGARAPAQARDKSPVGSALSKAQMGADNAANSVIAGTTKFNGFIRKALRAEVEEPSKKGILATPAYMVGNAIDATVLNAGRRAVEVLEPAISGIRAFCRLTIGNIIHPINMIAHPIERLAKPAIRMITSVVKSQINQIKIPVRAVDDIVDRGVTRNVKQANFQVGRVPLLGPLIEKPTNFITQGISHITAGIRRAIDFVTKPIDVIHDAVAPA